LLIIVAGFNGFVFYNTRKQGSKIMLIAVFFSALAALVFMNKWGISRWYNHFDISHTLLALSAIFFYRGSVIAIGE
jgi:hypothetical protein